MHAELLFILYIVAAFANLNNVEEAEHTPYLKSEAIPTNTYHNNVRVVVGKNWKEIVQGPNNDVLICYYAPWDGHYKHFEPIFSALGNKLRDIHGLVIAKMDLTSNEIEGLHVQGYPDIKFYSKNKKNNPVDYREARTEEEFIEFLKRHSSASLEHITSKSVEDEL